MTKSFQLADVLDYKFDDLDKIKIKTHVALVRNLKVISSKIPLELLESIRTRLLISSVTPKKTAFINTLLKFHKITISERNVFTSL